MSGFICAGRNGNLWALNETLAACSRHKSLGWRIEFCSRDHEYIRPMYVYLCFIYCLRVMYGLRGGEYTFQWSAGRVQEAFGGNRAR